MLDQTGQAINPSAWDFTKGKDMLDVVCDCGEDAAIFVGDINAPIVTICQKCGKKVYQLTCSKCGSGFSMSETAREINLAEHHWRCSFCKTQNDFSPDKCEIIPNYQSSEIPQSVTAQYPNLLQIIWRTKVGKIVIVGILLYLGWTLIFK